MNTTHAHRVIDRIARSGSLVPSSRWRLTGRPARAALLLVVISNSPAAHARRSTADGSVRDWIAANTRVVGHTPAVTSIYVTRAASPGACRLLLRTTDSSRAGQIQFVTEKTVDLDYRQLDAAPGIVRLADVWLVRVNIVHGQNVPMHTRMVIQREVWERNTRATFLELIAPTRASADTLRTLLHDAVTACNTPAQLAAGTEKDAQRGVPR